MKRPVLICGAALIHWLSVQACLGACTDSPPGLVSWWAGDGNASDLAGGNFGAARNGVSFVVGRVDLAFSFDGAGGYMTVPHSAELNPTGPFSVDAWVKASPEQSSVDHQFLVVDKSHGFVDGTGWALQGNPDGTVAFLFGKGGNSGDPANFVGVSTLVGVLDDQWHHVAGVFTGSRIEIYLDGVLNYANEFAGTPAGNDREVSIGRSWGGGAPKRYFHGLVDEVDFFNRALAPAEVAAIFSAGSDGKCKRPPSNGVSWLPAPGSIVYSRTTGANGSIWAFDPSTGRDEYLMEGTRPRLSPDGRYMVYLRDNGALSSRGNVYLRNLQEGTERIVYENHDYVVGATFAEEGRQVLFDAVCSILQIPRTGSTPTPLVSGSCWDDAPAADPFSGRVAFHNLSLRQIGIVNADGSDKHYLPPSAGEDVYPSWSPDGQWIVVANADSIQNPRGPGNVFKFRSDGSDRMALSFVSGDDAGFRANAIWTLDGKQILAAGRPADRNGMFRLDANGGGILERLDTMPGDDIDWVGGITPGDPASRGLVAWWRAEGSAADSAGRNDGTASPPVAYAARGKVGRAFDFAGQTHLEVADTPMLHAVRFTASAWVNFRSAARAQTILSKATQPNAPESFALWYADGQLWGRAGGPSADASSVAAALNPAPGTWYHLAYRFDGQTHTLFIDGVPVATTAGDALPEYTSHRLTIGARDQAGAATDVFDGLMDEVRLYSRALSDQEISLLRRRDRTRIQVALDPRLPEPLTLSWSADDQGVLVETVSSLGEVETWLPVQRRPLQVGNTQILNLSLSGLLGEGNSRFWRITLLQEGVQLFPVTLTVRNLEDDFAGSLRQAIHDAHPGDAIVFAKGLTGTIKLSSGALMINKDLRIIGPGAKSLTISGSDRAEVFHIYDSSSVTISGITITRGVGEYLAGGIVASGALTVADCVVRDNRGLVGAGGGITCLGVSFLRNCTITHNEARFGGGVYGSERLTVENCTIAENRAVSWGGGIDFQGEISILNSTVCGNQARVAGGVRVGSSQSTAKVSNSLIAGNSDSEGSPDCFSYAKFTSLGYNLIGNAGGSSGWGATGDQVGTWQVPLDPKLGPLQDNGGPTPTMAPLPGSKAIDQGRRNGLRTDQRGKPRPKNFPSIPDANYGDGSDIGAVEVQ